MRGKNKVLWITSTAIFIALLVVAQLTTSWVGNTLITGSVVNMILIVSVMTRGLASGVSVAAVSPVLARFFGIGPLWGIIPFQIAGNVTLVLLWFLIGSRIIGGNRLVSRGVAMVVAAAAKFLVLYVTIVRVAVPMLLGLPEAQGAAISKIFSVSQLFTALIGGALAILLLPRLTKAIGPPSAGK
jgi:hypothetical protein